MLVRAYFPLKEGFSLFDVLPQQNVYFSAYSTALSSNLHLYITQEWLLWISHHLKELHVDWFHASEGSDS